MDVEHLTVESEPVLEDVRFLEDRLYDYNVEKTGVDDGQWLALFVRDEQGTIRAGIEGWTWCDSCYIRNVWVHEDLRGQGVGTKLLQAAEQEAIKRGCQHLVLGLSVFKRRHFTSVSTSPTVAKPN